MPQLPHPSPDVHARVLLAFVQPSPAPPEELQQVLRAVPAEADPASTKDLLASNEESVLLDPPAAEQPHEFLPQVRRHDLIRLADQHASVPDRQVAQSPREDPRTDR